MSTHRIDRLRGVAALAVLAAVLAGPPAALVRFVGWPLPTSLPGFEALAASGRGGIDDAVVVNTLAVLAWLVWAQIALAVVVEAAGVVNGRSARRAPVLAGVQFGVARLVAACALVAGAAGSLRPSPLPARPIVSVEARPARPASMPEVPRLHLVAAATPASSGPDASYVAQQGDSWWGIAEEELGDGKRWKELRAANAGRTMPDGSVIEAASELVRRGWPLVMPATPGPRPAVPSANEAVVQRGDNLWSITEEHLADQLGVDPTPAQVRLEWAEVIELNRDRLADPAQPDRVYAGQVLRLPTPAAQPSTPASPDDSAVASALVPTAVEPVAAPPAPEPPAPPSLPDPTTTTAPVETRQAHGTPTSPATAIRPSPQNAEHHESAPLGMLGAAGTMVAVGVATAVARHRRRRQMALPPRALVPPPPAEFDGLRAELALRADADHADRLHRALRDVARALAEAHSDARPRLVQTSPGHVEVVLSRPVVPAPTPWRAEASGSAWTLAGEPRDTDGDGPAPAPALVSLGRPEAATELHLDLEAEGVVALLGDADAVGDVARSWTLELATSPLAAGASVLVIGDALSVVPASDRVRLVASWAEAAGDVADWVEQSCALVAANRWETPFTGRVGGHNDGLAPLVVLTERPDDERFASLCAQILDRQVAVVVVIVGDEVEGATRVEVSPEGLSIPALGLRCEAQEVSVEAAEQVEALFEDASRLPAQLSFLPARPAPIHLGGHDDEYHDPPFEILVRLLGEITVVGGTRRLKPQEVAVVSYIALHGPVSADRIEDAVWVAPTAARRRRLANTISACRSALGPTHLGFADADGRYDLGSKAITDTELFERRVAYAAGQQARAAAATLRGAIELVEGPVFTTRQSERSSFVWVDVEHWTSNWELAVTDAAEDLAGRYLDLADLDGAVWASRRGLEVCPTHGQLTKLLMEAHLAKGETEAARRVFESHQAALDKLDLDDPDAELLDVYQAARGDRGSIAT